MLFTFTAEDEMSHLSMEFEGESLAYVFNHFENFLKGAGFVIDGQIDVVQDCDCCESPNDELQNECKEVFPSTYAALDNLKIRFEKSE